MQMILGVIEGQIRGGYFPDCILDPSVVDPNVEPVYEEVVSNESIYGGNYVYKCLFQNMS